jgi:cytochrome c553
MKRLWIMLFGLMLILSFASCKQMSEEKVATEKKGEEMKKEMPGEEKESEGMGGGEESGKTGEMGKGMMEKTQQMAQAGASITAGKALFNDPGLGTAGKSCNSCHEDGKDLSGVGAKYSQMGEMAKVINGCIEKPLKGQPLQENSEKMRNLSAYLSSL